MKKAFIFILLFIFIVTASCKPSTDKPDTGLPSGLMIYVTVSADDPKTIIIDANATDAVNYELWTGSASQAALSSESGNFTYTFSAAGNYTITIRAYGSSGKFISSDRYVEIVIPVAITNGYSTPLQYDGYTLAWNDEFNGSEINLNYWTYESGDGCPNVCGWGNNELEYYKRDNCTVSGGALTIEARKESIGNRSYSSSRIKTQGLKSFRYGRIDVRALLPEGQGIWPAIWMLGDNISTEGWPKCGEIDIMEMIGGGGKEKDVYGTLHWDNNGHASAGGKYSLTTGTFADAYHVFTLTWDDTRIKWYVNDVLFKELDITPAAMSEFRQNFFFILNVAVGGSWPGNPDATTKFPQQMKVDYVRVFQK